MEFIDWNILEFKKTSGKEKLRCPACDSRRSDKKDRSLQVNHKEGYGKCHYCEALTFKDSKTESVTDKVYEIPNQDWRNYTKLSDPMVKWLEEERKIPQHVAIELGWTEEIKWQPKRNAKVNNLVFNYFEGSEVVQKKYRDGNKNFTQESNCKSIFYNINACVNADEIIIVEGELDLASLYACGIKNVISLPNGANNSDDYWINSKKYLDQVEKFIIWTDNDDKGVEVREQIAKRLGRFKCTFIDSEYKDANEAMKVSENEVKEAIKSFKRFPVSGTFTVDDLYDEIMDYYDNGLPDTISPKGYWWGDLSKIFSVMKGQVVLPTGIPSHGKSSFTDWYVLNLIKDYNFKASWFSPEHNPMGLFQTRFIENTLGRNFWKDKDGYKRLSKDEILEYKKWANEKIYLTDCGSNDLPTWNWILETFKEQMYSYGVDIFIIDAFNKVILPRGNKLEQINEVLSKLTHFARANNVIVFLVAHPTKMKKNEQTKTYDIPTLYDVSGSSDFRNQVHCGYTIYRYFEDYETGQENETVFINQKIKYNFQGEMGAKETFSYIDVNGRLLSKSYVESGGEVAFNLIDQGKIVNEKEKEKLPVMNPKDDIWDDNEKLDEVPF